MCRTQTLHKFLNQVVDENTFNCPPNPDIREPTLTKEQYRDRVIEAREKFGIVSKNEFVDEFTDEFDSVAYTKEVESETYKSNLNQTIMN